MDQNIQKRISNSVTAEFLFQLSKNEDIESLRKHLSDKTLYLLKDKDEFNVLHEACARGHLKTVLLCIEMGLDITIKGFKNRNALHVACRYGSIEIAKLLYDKNKSFVREKDQDGMTPLMLARREKHSAVVVFLYNVTSKNPLHEAVSEKDDFGVQAIISSGIDVDIKDSDLNNNTALQRALIKEDAQICLMLVRAGASVILRNGNNQDAIDMAIRKGSNFLRIILQGKECKEFVEILDADTDLTIANKLITSLLYRAKRHAWDSEKSMIIRRILVAYGYPLQFARDKFEEVIRKQETEKQSFFGSYLSDDSDSDEEKEFHKKDTPSKEYLKSESERHSFRAKFPDYMERIGSTQEITVSEIFRPLSDRQTIPHEYGAQDIQDATADLQKLNNLIAQLGSVKAAVNQTATDFFVAQYRGVTYLTTKWNQVTRRRHRKSKEVGKPQYSASVLFEVSRKSHFFEVFDGDMLKDTNNVEKVALILRDLLAKLKDTPKCSYQGYLYDNLAELLQSVYSRNYDEFLGLLRENLLLKNYLLNSYNPFVSTGDVPYHALKYAYGIKPYEGHHDARLRPRWRVDGKAERPYSGKVYVSVHPLTDYENHINSHIVDLNWNGKVELGGNTTGIIAERETSFIAYIGADRIVIEHTAKYPSFHHKQYKAVFLIKYGLSPVMYDKFKQEFFRCKPHTPEMKRFKQVLGEWLCSYYEVKLIDFARKIIQQKKQNSNRTSVLVYRDLNGLFTLKIPKDTPRGKTDPNNQLKKYRDDARNYRKGGGRWLSRIEFISSSDIPIQINPNLPITVNGVTPLNPSLCSFNDFYVAVSTGDVRKVEKLFYPLEYCRLYFSIPNQLASTTVLHMAAMRGQLEMVLFLLSKGSLINSRDSEGNTPLHIAIIHGHLLVAKQLLCCGASVLFISNKYETPYDTAVNRKKDDFISLLSMHSSDILKITHIQQRQKELENKNSELTLKLEATSKAVEDKSKEVEKLQAQVKELESKLSMQQQSAAKYQTEVAQLATRLVSISTDYKAELSAIPSGESAQLGRLAASIGKFSHKPCPPTAPSGLTDAGNIIESEKLQSPQ